jgi:hypothetical protein
VGLGVCVVVVAVADGKVDGGFITFGAGGDVDVALAVMVPGVVLLVVGGGTMVLVEGGVLGWELSIGLETIITSIFGETTLSLPVSNVTGVVVLAGVSSFFLEKPNSNNPRCFVEEGAGAFFIVKKNWVSLL